MRKKIKKKGKKLKKELPTGVKIISILYYISALIGLIVGAVLLLNPTPIKNLAEPYLSSMNIKESTLTILAFLILGSAVLEFFIGRGLWKKQKWARIAAIIIAAGGVIGAAGSISNSQISQINQEAIAKLIIHGAIGIYLLFSKQVKSVFS